MRRRCPFMATPLLLCLAVTGCFAQDALEQGFLNPPASARPHTWWHWMNGNITKEGITKDLEAMARVGIGGAQIFNANVDIPAGPVKFLSDDWRALTKHAITEANRLGIEICMHNCAGWSSSGGPYISLDKAMQMVTVSKLRVTGPTRLDTVLAQPPTRRGYYKDIAVLAFPSPQAETGDMLDPAPKVTSSVADFNPAGMLDSDPNTTSVLGLRRRGEPEYIQFEFEEPFTARSLILQPGGGRYGGAELQVSDEGEDFTRVASFGVPGPDLLRPPFIVNFPPATGRFFRLVFTRSGREVGSVALAELRLSEGYRIRDIGPKAGFVRGGDYTPDRTQIPADLAVPHGQVQDISAKMDGEGHLVWDVPAGNWTILRLGHTPTGKDNHPAPAEGTGPECDKLSKEAADAAWKGMVGKVIQDIGPLAGKTFNNVLIDSYEVDSQNWTPLMREEFIKRRGYDPLPYLPVITGCVVDSLEVSERFLWDLRRTIADLYADNYFGRFAELAHQHGMMLSVEPYGNGNFDDMQCGSRADITMSEFWVGQGQDNGNAKLASSIAHTWGKRIVGAESFTSGDSEGRWSNTPYSIKALGDFIWTGGVNRYIFHRYVHQPYDRAVPGLTLGPFGTHFERTNTWWEQSTSWMKYIARSQYLLQSGLFVADLLYLQSEGAPNSLPGRGGLQPRPPDGYDYDGCDAETVLTRLSVRDGKIVLPDGMSYRVLVLPPRETMTPALVAKVRDLVRDGATVVGPKPSWSPSLQGYPDCDRQVQDIAAELWGDLDGKTVTERSFGKGSIIWGKPLLEVLTARGVEPDVQWTATGRRQGVNWIHRNVDGADIYFVCSWSNRPEVVECSFRGTGRLPELWHPDTGLIEQTVVYREEDGRTVVPIRFDPCGSVFVVFRKPAIGTDTIVAFRKDGQSAFAPQPRFAGKLEITKAVYGVLTDEVPDCVDVTQVLARQVRNGTLTVQASNSLAGDPAVNVVKQMRVQYVLNGQTLMKTVDEGQTLRIPEDGKEGGTLEIRRALYGILPEEGLPLPQVKTVDVTEKLAAMVRDGTLVVAATNALAGDPVPLVVKQMRVDYLLDGKPYTRVVNENQVLELPEGSEVTGMPAAPPAPQIARTNGALAVTAWEPGNYEATLASGKVLSAQVAALPEPQVVTGSWDLRFPPNWGAPETATFERLMSWTESDVAGIKYFSGTATYSKTLTIAADLLEPGNVLLLDLGTVKELARVRLNGQDLGILWKPPFRLDITKAAKAGENALEVQVTNLWPNRMIGDEQLPPDANAVPGGPLRAWPDWLLQDKPRTSGRFTLATWQHYNKDSALLESGLLGPVVVRVGKVVEVR